MWLKIADVPEDFAVAHVGRPDVVGEATHGFGRVTEDEFGIGIETDALDAGELGEVLEVGF